jgi:serine/threonine protein phosphatase PrpC
VAVNVRGWHATDVGCVRDHNEDNGFVDPNGRFFICADGMGGHAAGDVASAMAVEELSVNLEVWPPEFDQLARSPDADHQRAALAILEYLLKSVNARIHQRGKTERTRRGMGCTCDIVIIAGHFALCGHVGDSRQYLIRAGQTQQLTQDHSLAPLPEPGKPPQKGPLWSALGPYPTCKVDTFTFPLQPGDRILLCSDGLADYFPHPSELGSVLAARGDEAGMQSLIQLAKQRGGADNITIVLARVDHGAAAVARPAPAARQAPQQAVTPGKSLIRTLPIDRSADGLIEKRMPVFMGSELFASVPPSEIAKLLCNAAEVTLPAGQPIPRAIKGADVAWLILRGLHKGHLLYPEALAAPQADWPDVHTVNEDMLAMPLTRADFQRFCSIAPDAGVVLVGNVARLVAAELRRRMRP